MFFIVIEITFIVLFTISFLGLCSAREQNVYSREKSKEKSISEKDSSLRNCSPLRSRRARPLEQEEFIPIAEGAENNPDVKKMIDERSHKSQRLQRGHRAGGFVMGKDKVVRRLEDNSIYEPKTSARYKRSHAAEVNPSAKSKRSAKSPGISKRSKKSKKEKKKSERSKSSKKEKKEKSGKELEKKKSSVREKKDIDEQEAKGEVKDPEEKPKKFQKIRKPWKKLFKLKRKKARNDVHVTERNGTWA